jgi:hypothetical protein
MNQYYDPLPEKAKEAYEYIKPFLVGLTFNEAKELLNQLISDLGDAATISDKP